MIRGRKVTEPVVQEAPSYDKPGMFDFMFTDFVKCVRLSYSMLFGLDKLSGLTKSARDGSI